MFRAEYVATSCPHSVHFLTDTGPEQLAAKHNPILFNKPLKCCPLSWPVSVLGFNCSYIWNLFPVVCCGITVKFINGIKQTSPTAQLWVAGGHQKLLGVVTEALPFQSSPHSYEMMLQGYSCRFNNCSTFGGQWTHYVRRPWEGSYCCCCMYFKIVHIYTLFSNALYCFQNLSVRYHGVLWNWKVGYEVF